MTGSLSPTGGIGLKDKYYNIQMQIELVDIDPIETLFIPRIYLNMANLFNSEEFEEINGKMELAGTDSEVRTEGIFGVNSGSYSVIVPAYKTQFKAGLKVILTAFNVKYKENYKAKSMTSFVDLYFDTESFIERRVLIPFHPFSFVAADQGAVTTRFTSSHGFLTTSYITFEYPQCMTLPSLSTFTNCHSITWLKPENGITTTAQCMVEGQTLIVRSLGWSYPASKSQTIRFTIDPETYNGCDKTSYVEVSVLQTQDNKESEHAVLFGLDQEPLNETEVAALEAAYDAGQTEGDFSMGLGVITSLLITLIVLIF